MKAEVDSKQNRGLAILQDLKADILRGYFAPGEKLLMSALKERYGVGVSPIREALSQLVSEQLVVAQSQRGFKVSPISRDELLDIYETRAHIEALALELALERGDDQWEAQIVAEAHRLFKIDVSSYAADTLLEVWEERHRAFHQAMVKGCGSVQLLQVRQILYDRAERYRRLWLKETLMNAESLARSKALHQDLLEAVLSRDKVAVKALIHPHLMKPVEVIKATLSAKQFF
ncbi:DNA-binding transcriptional regulator CsiR [Balneatrix alpica]|uniref:DNA-binding transcriptional regulator CsiR n=1 Tax=Balneatrix alpica TaxID=75684 RepID=A0ABV5ZA93_9GAMM|nr:DNA-binding transcriptional regulator CsiR [Balneatrix alpica]